MFANNTKVYKVIQMPADCRNAEGSYRYVIKEENERSSSVRANLKLQKGGKL